MRFNRAFAVAVIAFAIVFTGLPLQAQSKAKAPTLAEEFNAAAKRIVTTDLGYRFYESYADWYGELAADAKKRRDAEKNKKGSRYKELDLRYKRLAHLQAVVGDMATNKKYIERVNIDTNYEWPNKEEKLKESAENLKALKVKFRAAIIASKQKS
jgi:hypothetical protein